MSDKGLALGDYRIHLLESLNFTKKSKVAMFGSSGK